MHRVKKREIGDDSNQLWNLPPLEGRIFALDWSADGKKIAAGSSLNGRGAVHIYSIDPEYKVPGEIDGIIKTPTHKRNDAQKKKLGQYFERGIKTLAEIDFGNTGIYAVAFNPDGTKLAAAGADGRVRLYQTADGSPLRAFIPVPLAE
jgi:WD40 repeat protein